MDYKESGVDVIKGEQFSDRIRAMVQSVNSPNVLSGVGGYAAIYDIGGGTLLASGVDGVGTKLKLAFELDLHDTIGIDLVAMCVNDIICTGAKPLFFLDYYASGKLDLKTGEQIIKGIVEGCRLSSCSLIGGETAEMPGFYKDGEYDLSGTAIGITTKDKWITGKNIKPGQRVIGLGSSGFHSNGYSLARKILTNNDEKQMLLEPTRIYVNSVMNLLNRSSDLVTGLAHITGGGVRNLLRLNKNVGFELNWPGIDSLRNNNAKNVFSSLKEKVDLSDEELFSTFNMGIGFVCVLDCNDSEFGAIKKTLESENQEVYDLGSVTDQAGIVSVNGFSVKE
jgi:phosphoribosylformylglycinamidine cyclo-ligase